MRINKFIATYSEHSRRAADQLITDGRVNVNRKPAHAGMDVTEKDIVVIDGKKLRTSQVAITTILLHKPVGYVCSHDGQGSPTVYDLLPSTFSGLNIAGRLDKDSSGLVVLTNDGNLLNTLTHPSNDKEKVYIVSLSKPLADGAIAAFAIGVDIGDNRLSKLSVLPLAAANTYEVRIHEGRNRQIRRSFEAAGYHVVSLHRTNLGPYSLDDLAENKYRTI